MIFVLDASSLIAFYSDEELNRPDLLHSLANDNNKLLIPIAVFTEIKEGHKRTFAILKNAIAQRKIEVSDDVLSEEAKSFGQRYPSLHYGEIHVLLLGLRFKARSVPYFCIIDEGPARIVAFRNDIATKGTKGLLFLLNQLGLIDRSIMEKLLYRLDHCNFRLK